MASLATQNDFVVRLFRRGVSYGSVGMSTFLLDLLILFLLTQILSVHYQIAVAISFLISISINYLVCYRFIYRGTERSIVQGYLIFAFLALCGIAIIVPAVTFLVEDMGLNVFVARMLVGLLIGTTDFLINTFYNFKIV